MADAPFVYLDWAATAPLSLEAARAMAPYLEAGTAGLVQGSGNANALHTAGRDAFKTLEAARRDIEIGIMDGVEVLAGFRILIDLGDIFEADAFFHFFHQSVTSFIFLLVPKCLMKVFMSRTEP